MLLIDLHSEGVDRTAIKTGTFTLPLGLELCMQPADMRQRTLLPLERVSSRVRTFPSLAVWDRWAVLIPQRLFS